MNFVTGSSGKIISYSCILTRFFINSLYFQLYTSDYHTTWHHESGDTLYIAEGENSQYFSKSWNTFVSLIDFVEIFQAMEVFVSLIWDLQTIILQFSAATNVRYELFKRTL